MHSKHTFGRAPGLLRALSPAALRVSVLNDRLASPNPPVIHASSILTTPTSFKKLKKKSKENLLDAKEMVSEGTKQLAIYKEHYVGTANSNFDEPTRADIVLLRQPRVRYPHFLTQAGVVMYLSAKWAEATQIMDLVEKGQNALFMRKLIDEIKEASAGRSKSPRWGLANAVGSATTDRYGGTSILAGYAHTADFPAAFEFAENTSGQKIDPLIYFISYAPIEISIRKKILPYVVSKLTGTENLLTTGINLHSVFPVIFKERTIQFAKYLESQRRFDDIALHEDLKHMYAGSDPELMNLIQYAYRECEELIQDTMEMVNNATEEASLEASIASSRDRFEEVED